MEGDIVSDESDIVAMAEEEEEKEKAGARQYDRRAQYVSPRAPRWWHERAVQRAERWIFLYNVTTGLYMLDWWERCVFNAVFLVFFAVAGYNSAHYLQRIGAGLLAWAWSGGGEGQEILLLGDGAVG